VMDTMGEWLSSPGENAWVVKAIVLPLTVLTGIILIYITLMPMISRMKRFRESVPHGTFTRLSAIVPANFKRIAIAIDFSDTDHSSISHAILQGGKEADYVLIHIVETAGALIFGKDIHDYETESDERNLKMYAENLTSLGYKNTIAIGYGRPKNGIVAQVKVFNADLLVMGAHGHKGFKDILFGTTVDAVRHALDIPVLIVR